VERIEGRNPVREALRAGRPIARILVAEGAQERGSLAEILSLAARAGVRVERVPRAGIAQIAATSAHQGVLAEAPARPSRSWRDAVELARSRGEPPLLLAVDGITDPQNLGSLIRSAEALGAHGVLVPERRAAPLSAAVAKASAGATEHLIVSKGGNLARTLAACRAEGLWLIGLDGAGEIPVDGCELLAEPAVLVVGSEGAGLSRLVRERCDVRVRIRQKGAIASLGAAAAGAIALFEAQRLRHL
jgi:23S rRNA (guanosine2251-2'-O)-methyltransferase